MAVRELDLSCAVGSVADSLVRVTIPQVFGFGIFRGIHIVISALKDVKPKETNCKNRRL